MISTPGLSLFILLLPLLVAGGSLLAFASCTVPGARQHAYVLALASALLTALACLLIASDGGAVFTASQLLVVAMAMLAAQCIAAPLLDRARTAGLLAASIPAALLLLDGMIGSVPPALPPIAAQSILLTSLIAACLIGLVGSACLPVHPARFTPHGVRLSIVPQGWVCAGLGLLATACAGLGWMLTPAHAQAPLPLAISALSAASIGLLVARRQRYPLPLRKACEGLVAGLLTAMLLPGSDPATGLLAGALAAFAVLRGEPIAQSIRLDDAPHLTGTVFLPAIAGLLLPGLLRMEQLAAQLQWLGASLLLGALLALLWPLGMAIFGIAASPRRVREGLDFQL